MTDHCDLTMQFSNTSDQRGKSRAALNYYVLARRSNAKILAKYQLSERWNE